MSETAKEGGVVTIQPPPQVPHQGIGKELNQAGHHGFNTVPAAEQPPQYGIGNAANAVDAAENWISELGEKITGENIDTKTRFAANNKMHKMVEGLYRFKERLRGK